MQRPLAAPTTATRMPPNEHQPPSNERGVRAPQGPTALLSYQVPQLEADEEVQKLLTDPTLLVHLSDVVTILDHELRLRYLSRATARPACDLIGASIIDLTLEEDRARVRGVLEAALRGHEHVTMVSLIGAAVCLFGAAVIRDPQILRAFLPRRSVGVDARV